MYSAQEITNAVKSVTKGFRPTTDSISLDVSDATDIDVLLTYALTARSLDEASAAVERVLELDPENEVANAGFTWFLGVRDSAERLDESNEDESENKSEEDAPTAKAVEAIEDSSEEDSSAEEESFSCEFFGKGLSEKATDDAVSEDDTSGNNSGFSAFQQAVASITSNEQDDDVSAEAAEQEEKERAEAEAAAEAEQEEKERAEAEAAAEAEREEKERAEAEAAAETEREEKERAEAEAAAEAEQEERERAEAEAAAEAEQEERERAEAEAAAEAEQEERERAEAEAAAKAVQKERERAEAAKAEQEEEAVVAEAEELADEVHEAATASLVIEPAKPGEKLTILTVDDSPTIRKLLMMTLEREGFNVVQAQDGVEALVKMSECNPVMILSDINMPRLDGYKLCKFVKKHAKTKHIPVIMLSGKDGVFDKLRGRMSGCDGYLTKPFESKDLLEKIRSFIGTTA